MHTIVDANLEPVHSLLWFSDTVLAAVSDCSVQTWHVTAHSFCDWVTYCTSGDTSDSQPVDCICTVAVSPDSTLLAAMCWSDIGGKVSGMRIQLRSVGLLHTGYLSDTHFARHYCVLSCH